MNVHLAFSTLYSTRFPPKEQLSPRLEWVSPHDQDNLPQTGVVQLTTQAPPPASLQINETETMVIVFGYDSSWGVTLICFATCWPGHFPRTLAGSPGHVTMEPRFSRSLLPLPRGLSSLPLTLHPNQVAQNPPTSKPSSNWL